MRLLLSLVVVVVVAGAAHADNREDARKEFAAGQAADKDKDYQSAIEHYLRAYELVPHHFALFNIATAYERLGQLREAAQWFERYLDEAPQSLVKERREVERVILELKLRPAKLTINTTPRGARVLIDGQPVGVSPYTKPIRGGGHRVRVELEGQREERDVALEYGEPQSIEMTLNVRAKPTNDGGLGNTGGTQPVIRNPHAQTQTTGLLAVTGSPEGALVAIDDQVVGRVGGEFHVEPGSHNLKVTLYGYQTHDESVNVTTGQTTSVAVELKPGTSTPPPSPGVFGYYFGATVGADVRGGGAQYMGELGYRVFVIDIGLRVGKASSRTTLDVIFRWTVLRTKLSPFIHAGYSAAASEEDAGGSSSSFSGYLLGGGLRYDLVRGDSSAVSLLAESGVRVTATSTASEDKTVYIPFLASIQLTFGSKSPNR